MGDLLGIGTSALNATQRMLDTVGHNIANVNTPGYSRQSTELGTRPALSSGQGYIGSGVSVSSTTRYINQFVNNALVSTSSTHKELATFQEYINVVDNLLADSETGISTGLNDFFASLNEVNNHPDSTPARQVFLSQANLLTSRFNDIDNQLNALRFQANDQAKNIVSQINSIAKNLADLNVSIISAGQQRSSVPNDLLDQRDEQVRKLSELVHVDTIAQSDGALNVFIGSGQTLVISGTSNQLSTSPSRLDPKSLDINVGTGIGVVNINASLLGGELGGVLSVNESVIAPTQNALGRVATTIAMTFNDQHQKGIDAQGNSGIDMFQDVNLLKNAQDRVFSNLNNAGNARFSVTINPISLPSDELTQVFSPSSNLTNVGTLTSLSSNFDLILNGVAVRAAVVGDDTVSSVDSGLSAIAISAAINSSSIQHGVTASAQQNVLNLGQFSPGAFALGEFQINGISVVTLGTDSQTLVQDINALKTQTGVEARLSNDGSIELVTLDGRNIQLTSNTNTPVATFTYFDTNSAVALNQMKRAEVLLTSDSGQINIAGTNPGNIGLSAGNNPANASALTISDYSLTMQGGQYTLRRLSDDAIVGQGSNPNFNVDGFTLNLDAGTMAAGDEYLITPTRIGASTFQLNLTKTSQLALASPVRVEGAINNQGSGVISLVAVNNTSGSPASTATQLGNAFSSENQLLPPIRIEFQSTTTYNIYDVSQGVPGVQIGPTQVYDPSQIENRVFPVSGVVDKSLPGPNPTYVYDPGYQINLQGQISKGDVFSIGYNRDASNDNSNGFALVGLQNQRLMNNGSTFQSAFAEMVGEVGSVAAKTNVNEQASAALLRSLETRRNEVSGVNLDEEAANLIKFEQQYQAAAQLISISRQIFDELINSFGR